MGAKAPITVLVNRQGGNGVSTPSFSQDYKLAKEVNNALSKLTPVFGQSGMIQNGPVLNKYTNARSLLQAIESNQVDQIGILNSCVELGIVSDISNINLTQAIDMVREAVNDEMSASEVIKMQSNMKVNSKSKVIIDPKSIPRDERLKSRREIAQSKNFTFNQTPQKTDMNVQAPDNKQNKTIFKETKDDSVETVDEVYEVKNPNKAYTPDNNVEGKPENIRGGGIEDLKNKIKVMQEKLTAEKIKDKSYRILSDKKPIVRLQASFTNGIGLSAFCQRAFLV